mmetsp:Transcript_92261/g.257860  ORF Transcript_92261/g.257860 Transcript_92261/m.257860 type:complete len:89 (+) Transcript_92261:1-267(+)
MGDMSGQQGIVPMGMVAPGQTGQSGSGVNMGGQMFSMPSGPSGQVMMMPMMMPGQGFMQPQGFMPQQGVQQGGQMMQQPMYHPPGNGG